MPAPARTSRAALLAAALVPAALTAGCTDDDLAAPSERGFRLELRNLAVQRGAGAVQNRAEFTLAPVGDTDPEDVEGVTITWPEGVWVTSEAPVVEERGGGPAAVVVEPIPMHDPPPAGTYDVAVRFVDGELVTFTEAVDFTPLGDFQVLESIMGDVFTVRFAGPDQAHDWTVELWRRVNVEDNVFELVRTVAEGTSEGGDEELEVEVEYRDAVEPGQLFSATIVLQDAQNRRERWVTKFAPEG